MAKSVLKHVSSHPTSQFCMFSDASSSIRTVTVNSCNHENLKTWDKWVKYVVMLQQWGVTEVLITQHIVNKTFLMFAFKFHKANTKSLNYFNRTTHNPSTGSNCQRVGEFGGWPMIICLQRRQRPVLWISRYSVAAGVEWALLLSLQNTVEQQHVTRTNTVHTIHPQPVWCTV